MSNLLKYNSFVVKDTNDFVIDSNQKVMDKISSIKKNIKAASFITPGEPDADGFVSGLNAQVVEELTEPEEAATQEELNVQTEEILEAARNEADNIISQAHKEAEYYINAAKDEGYEQGLKNASADVDKKLRSNLNHKRLAGILNHAARCNSVNRFKWHEKYSFILEADYLSIYGLVGIIFWNNPAQIIELCIRSDGFNTESDYLGDASKLLVI